MFSCGRMIRLLAHLLPPYPFRKLYLFLILPVCRWSNLNWLKKGGWGGWGGESYDPPRKPGHLYIIQYSLIETHLGIWWWKSMEDASWLFLCKYIFYIEVRTLNALSSEQWAMSNEQCQEKAFQFLQLFVVFGFYLSTNVFQTLSQLWFINIYCQTFIYPWGRDSPIEFSHSYPHKF